MTAICLRAKSLTGTDTWSKIFTDFNTETGSCLFIRQLTRTCISTILYLRKILPDDCFESKSFEELTLKLLKSSREGTSVFKVEQWLEGAFEAMEKKYLRRLMLDIQDIETNKTLEIYTMTFNYNEKDLLNTLVPIYLKKDSEAPTTNTKLNTIKLLQMCCAVTQTYNSLPTKVKLSMRLSYYDNTPVNYQPRGYKALEFVEPEFPDLARSIEIGLTETQFHFFKFIHKSCLNDSFFKLQNMNEGTENASATLPLEENDEFDQIQSRQTTMQKEMHLDVKESPKTSLLVQSNQNLENINQASEKRFEQKKLYSKTEEYEVAVVTKNTSLKCINKGKLQVKCACFSTEKSSEMLECLSCKFAVHAECFGILQLDHTKKLRFYCHLCHQKQKNFKCHDKVMVSLNNSSDQQKLSLLRRVLRYCTTPSAKKITLKKMEKIAGNTCQKTVVKVVLNKMIEIGVVIPQEKKKQLVIQKEILAGQLVHYFYKVQRPNHRQSEASRHNLRVKNKTKNDSTEFNQYKKSIQSNTTLQGVINSNSQISDHSCDIFSERF